MITSCYKFFNDLYKSRYLLWQMTKRDFKSRYMGSYLGLIWAFIHPIIMIALFWFVFEIGFRAKSEQSDCPYILWLVTGIVPWFFIADSLSMATNSILENSHLVKKVIFRVSLLPIVKILSCLIIHLFFILIIFILFALYGRFPSLAHLQIVYFLFCTLVLLLGLSWLTSSLVIFFKDISQLVLVFIQVGFWATPIFWSMTSRINPKYHFIFLANPFFYITEGYRKTFINHAWFWQNWKWTLYFWLFTTLIFIIGATVFRKLRPHFADVI